MTKEKTVSINSSIRVTDDNGIGLDATAVPEALVSRLVTGDDSWTTTAYLSYVENHYDCERLLNDLIDTPVNGADQALDKALVTEALKKWNTFVSSITDTGNPDNSWEAQIFTKPRLRGLRTSYTVNFRGEPRSRDVSEVMVTDDRGLYANSFSENF